MAFLRRYYGILDQLLEDPDADIEGFGSATVNCLRLCEMRDECLRQAGFQDAYKQVKVRPFLQALLLALSTAPWSRSSALQYLDQVTQPAMFLARDWRPMSKHHIMGLGP